MKKNKRAFRWTCVGILCAGLLLVGVGAGLGLAEAATFTYAGERLPEAAAPGHQTLTVHLRGDGGQVHLDSYEPDLWEQMRNVARIEVSEDVAPKTMELDLRYDSVGMHLSYWYDNEEGTGADQRVNLYWKTGGDFGVLIACKDQILSDIKDRKIGDYTAAQLTDAVITVNPADADRVTIG